MKIHKEGYTIIPITFILIVGLFTLTAILMPSDFVRIPLGITAIAFFLLIVNFFRSRKVLTPDIPNRVIAPAEGKVVVVEKTFETEYLEGEYIQLSIFMSPMNVHVNYAPVDGHIDYHKYHPGKFLVAWHPKSSTDNERNTIGYQLENGSKVLMRQIAGALARRIRFYKKENDVVSAGDEVGFIRFGSRVDVFIPCNAKINVRIGDKTTAGETVLATL